MESHSTMWLCIIRYKLYITKWLEVNSITVSSACQTSNWWTEHRAEAVDWPPSSRLSQPMAAQDSCSLYPGEQRAWSTAVCVFWMAFKKPHSIFFVFIVEPLWCYVTEPFRKAGLTSFTYNKPVHSKWLQWKGQYYISLTMNAEW